MHGSETPRPPSPHSSFPRKSQMFRGPAEALPAGRTGHHPCYSGGDQSGTMLQSWSVLSLYPPRQRICELGSRGTVASLWAPGQRWRMEDVGSGPCACRTYLYRLCPVLAQVQAWIHSSPNLEVLLGPCDFVELNSVMGNSGLRNTDEHGQLFFLLGTTDIQKLPPPPHSRDKI